MVHLKKFIQTNFLLIILLAIFTYIFGFRFDWLSLTSWDEGWYASIAREMVRSGNYLIMNWNGKPFYDHPPLGMWFMAMTYLLFGISEFSTRLPSVLMGIGSIVLIYFLSVQLFRRRVIGFIAACILGTAVWYVIRVRSGNLDSPFVFFYVFTLYTAAKAGKNSRWFPVVGLAFAGLVLTKTLVGLSALPLIGYLIFSQLLSRKMSTYFYMVSGVGLFLLSVLPWYYTNNTTFPEFYQHHFFTIGTRNKSADSYFHLIWEQPLFYLHMGVRKWYYLWEIALGYLVLKQIAYMFMVVNSKLRKYISARSEIFLILWNIVILYPFLTSDRTELWHLIPVYIPLAVTTAYAFYNLGEIGTLIFNKIIKIKKWQLLVNRAFVIFYLLGFLFLAGVQVKNFYSEVYPQSRSVPDDVDIAQKAGKYNKEMYLDDDYLPLAVYYTGNNNLKQLAYEPEGKKTLTELFQSDTQDFIVITRNWAVENLDKNEVAYKLLEKNNSFSILSK